VYRLAASRDGPEGVARTYVQHLIQQDAKRIWELVGTKGAWVYISGCVREKLSQEYNSIYNCSSANKMPVAVKEAIRFAVEKEGGKTPEEASRFVREMERVGRLLEECWS
jgi:sulfite reductase alpha subunit-like flavoprotein